MSDDTPTPTDPTGETPATLTEAPQEERVDGESLPLNGPTAGATPDPDQGAIPDLVEPPAEVRPSTPLYAGELPAEGLGLESEAEDAAAPASERTTLADRDGPTTRTDAAGPVTAIPAELAGATTAAPVQTVYVTAPLPPRARGNRGAGMLLALAATVAFAVLLAVVATLVRAFAGPGDFSGADSVTAAFTSWLPGFLAVPLFYVPVGVFLVLFIIFVVIANRAGWGVYVLGSFLLAVALYFASIGVLLALDGVFIHSTRGASVAALAVNPAIIIATVLAREVTIWFGAAIGARGRRVKARNAEEVENYQRETTQQKVELERAQFGAAS